MAVLLYYSARREEPFSERKKDVCWQTMARYGKEYPFAKRHDDMGAAFDLGDGIAFAGGKGMTLMMRNTRHFANILNLKAEDWF